MSISKINFSLQLLFATVWLMAVIIEGRSAPENHRETKQLLFLNSYSPYTTSPILVAHRNNQLLLPRTTPDVRQIGNATPTPYSSNLGPFFGYFPSMFEQPCPKCTECPPIEKAETINVCGAETDPVISAAPSGTIRLELTGETAYNCFYGISAAYPNTKVVINCKTASSDTFFKIHSPVTPAISGEAATPNTDYTSNKNYANVRIFSTVADGSFFGTFDVTCSWKSVP